MPALKDYVIAARPWSFSMSAISVALGTFVAWRSGPVEWGWFLLVVAGMVLCHAGGNVLNDYFDSRNEVDQADSATARYRPHPIVGGLLAPRAVLAEAVVLFLLAALIGATLVVFRTPIVFWIALAGLLLTVFYTAGPINLKYRALGEVAVFLVWGPLMFLGAYAVQRETLGAEAVVASIPFGVLVALVLYANNMRDIEQDARSGILTLGTLLGPSRALTGFTVMMLAAYAYVIAAVLLGALTPWSLLVLLSAPTAIGLLRKFRAGVPDAADAMTAQLDTVFGLLFMAALVLDRVVRP
jgi:1,4-dihydroxy-2-naphthoate octaprenyltransferase